MADIPLSKLASSAPEYDRPWVETPAAGDMPALPAITPIEALKSLIGSPNYAHKAWVWQQYDTQVGADTIRRPGMGAGVVRVHGTNKALAFTSDVTPRYVKANPFEGGKQAVAEAYRNLTAVGALPLATTDNLNFGNPEKPEIMGQLVGAIKGIGEACRALDFPIVSGNVSLYNETDGSGIMPTPTIGGVGLIANLDDLISGLPSEGDVALVIGTTVGHLGQSALAAEAFGIEAGDAPHVDLAAERLHGEFLRANRDLLSSATDLSDGGLALAAFEMAESGGLGLSLDSADIAQLFGEDQARYLVACTAHNATALADAAVQAGVSVAKVGQFGGDTVKLGDDASVLADLSSLYRSAFAKAIKGDMPDHA
jgi:phosphoribosylformylglycinamidine synthase